MDPKSTTSLGQNCCSHNHRRETLATANQSVQNFTPSHLWCVGPSTGKKLRPPPIRMLEVYQPASNNRSCDIYVISLKVLVLEPGLWNTIVSFVFCTWQSKERWLKIVTMDHRAIFEMIDAAVFNMENSTSDELMQLLNYVEHVVIEDKKTELIQDRITFICLANLLAAAMERDFYSK